MTYKATIDIAVNIAYLRLKVLNKLGYLRYRLKFYYTAHQTSLECHPYSIIKGKTHNKPHSINPQVNIESELDSDHYYSKVIQIRYRGDDWEENQTIFFKAYVQVDQLDTCQFYCEVQPMFSEDPLENFEIIGQFKAQIRKIYDISTYLPISFDQFEGFSISATFHAIIMEFKYDSVGEKDPEQPVIQSNQNSYDFWSYLDSITNGFNKQDIQQFYDYYRGFLEHQFTKLEERHSSLLKDQFQQNYSFTKLSKNFQVFVAIQNLHNKKLLALNSSQQQKLVHVILNDFSKIKGEIYGKWINFMNFVTENSKLIADLYKKQYREMCNDRFKNNVFSHRIKNHDWKYSKYEDSGKNHIDQAYKEKKKIFTEKQLWGEHFPVENCRFFGHSQTNIKMFQQVFENQKKIVKNEKFEGKHFIVLVHGFQASREDFVYLKNCLQINYNVQVFISTCNEGITESSIMSLGKRLSIELSKMLIGGKKEYRLSFIGHSMGGLIIRAAIPHLKQFSQKFYSYISLSTPHLGYLYTPPPLTQAGLWVMNTWNKCDSIQELSMLDNSDIKETTLYKLSCNSGLDRFKKICFIGSSQDEYVPYESARVQYNRKIVKKLKESNGEVIGEMVSNMFTGLIASQVSRINVVFNIPDKNFDSFIGRTGHIKFLSDTQFIRQFCCCFGKFFE